MLDFTLSDVFRSLELTIKICSNTIISTEFWLRKVMGFEIGCLRKLNMFPKIVFFNIYILMFLNILKLKWMITPAQSIKISVATMECVLQIIIYQFACMYHSIIFLNVTLVFSLKFKLDSITTSWLISLTVSGVRMNMKVQHVISVLQVCYSYFFTYLVHIKYLYFRFTKIIFILSL